MIQITMGYKGIEKPFDQYLVVDQTIRIVSETTYNGFDCDRPDIGENPCIWPRGAVRGKLTFAHLIFVPNDPKGYLELCWTE